MSSRSSSPLSSVQDLSEPEMDYTQPSATSKHTYTSSSSSNNNRHNNHHHNNDEDDDDDEVLRDASSSPTPPPHKRRKVIDARDPLPEDNFRYAFIVAFQAKFNQLFRGVPNLGPQDIEAGVAETPIADSIEALLCKLLGLALNRQKQVEKGHYGRALEEAVATYIDEAPPEWEGKNPLEGGKTFNQMSLDERLVMLQTLVLWALRHSKAITDILKEIYKPGRKTDDSNISLAIHPWGMDREKNKYYLIEGKDDTHFRVYQEHISPSYRNATWISVASTIEDLHTLSNRLLEEGSKNAKELSSKILQAIPRFEEGEIKRKRREYRTQRRAQFSTHPFQGAGMSLYEGRTRGNKAKYTFDSDEEGGYTSGRATRSTRASGRESPVENYVTGSGRVTRRTQQFGFSAAETGAGSGAEATAVGSAGGAAYAGSESGGSTRRSGRTSLKRDRGEYEHEVPTDNEEEIASEDEEEGEGGDDYRDEGMEADDDEELSDASDELDIGEGSLIVELKFSSPEGREGFRKIVVGGGSLKSEEGEKNDSLREKSEPQVDSMGDVSMAHTTPSTPPASVSKKANDSIMDLDNAEDVDDDDVDLVPTPAAKENVILDAAVSAAPPPAKPAFSSAGTSAVPATVEGGDGEHLIVNYLKGGNSSSPTSSAGKE